MKKIRKILSAALATVMALSSAAALAEGEEAKPQALVMEFEKSNYTGDVFIESNPKMSGGGGLTINQPNAQDHELTFNFNIDVAAEYEIRISSTLGNTDYVSKIKWGMDGEEYRAYSGPTSLVNAGYTGTHGVPISWCKLDTRFLEAGEHTITFAVNDIRDMGEFMLACFDSCVISPKSWNWTPAGVMPPYNASEMKLSYVSGEISAERVYCGDKIKVDVVNQCDEVSPYDAPLIVELRYKNGKVVNTIFEPKIAIKKWKLGRTYKNSASLTVPFNAPDGEYEIWTGINGVPYSNGSEMEKVGDIKIGNDVVFPEKAEATVENFEIPDTISRGEEFSVKAKVTSNRDIETAAGYLEFYSGKELWYVAELGEIPGGIKKTSAAEIDIKGIIDEDVPDGEYSVSFGIHTMKANGETKSVTIDGGTFTGERTYKPLSNGKYIPDKTGNCHLWYVNQFHTLIWDGEPYIPMGGMVCPNYIIWFDNDNPEVNKNNWDSDMAMLKMLKEKGIEHVYFNTCKWINDIPVWAWESYFAEVEKLGIKYGIQLGASYHESDYYAIRAAKAQISAKATGAGEVSTESDINFTPSGAGNVLESSCAYVAIDDQTGEAADSGIGKTQILENGKMQFTADIKVPSGSYSVYFTPWVSVNETMSVDPFKLRTEQEAEYKRLANSLFLGDNFRDFIDILSNESGYANSSEAIRHTGDLHDTEYEKWLMEKYKNIDALNASWGMRDAIDSFTTAAKLIPMFTNIENTEKAIAMDMRNSKTYIYDAKGLLWDDYLEFRDLAALAINNDASDWIKSTDNTNVPVVIKHVSVLADYNTQNRTVGGFDGLGGEIYGDISMASAKRTYPYSEVEQASKTMWYIITETNTEENMVLKTENEDVTYPSKEYMFEFFDNHLEQGFKGIYDFVVYGTMNQYLLVYSYHTKPETYDWAKEYREKVEKDADKIASQLRMDGRPKQSYIYPGVQAWWPVTNRRAAALDSSDYGDTRIFRFGDELVHQTFDPKVDKNILFVNLEDAPATKRYGPELNEYLNDIPKDERVVYLGLRKDLGELPEIDKYFTDEIVENADGSKYQVLKPSETSKVIYQTDGKPWAIQDGNIYIVSKTDWNGGIGESDQYTKVNYIEELGLGQQSQGKTSDNKNGFIDIDSSWAHNDILDMYNQGIVAGKTEELYCPEDDISRAELIAMIFRAMKYKLYDYNGCYDDVNAADWYAPVMQTANDTKIIDSAMLDGRKINPNKAITREEAASIISHICVAAGMDGTDDMKAFKDSADISDWALYAMANAVNCGIFSGDDKGMLKPADNITRAEAASVIKRFMAKYLEE